MSPKNASGYYEAYKRQAQFCEEMAQGLRAGMEAGKLGTKELVDSLHALENDADRVNHEIQRRLLHDFVVPLDRDGMSSLAHTLDDVVDAVEQIAILVTRCLCGGLEREVWSLRLQYHSSFQCRGRFFLVP